MKKLQIQSLLFARSKWTPATAAKWLKAHKYKTPPVEETFDFLRYRQAPPLDFEKGSFVTKEFSEKQGIKAILAWPKKAKKKNPPKKQKKQLREIPLTLVQLGDCLSITSDSKKKMSFKKSWLFSNQSGKMLFIIEKTKTKKADLPKTKKGIRLYETWTEFDPDSGFRFKMPSISIWRTAKSKAVEIVYRSDKWSASRKKTDYVHEFETPCKIEQGYQPGKEKPSAVILKGAFSVTKRGLEG